MMETHRTLHDFGELSYDDVADIHSAVKAGRSTREKIRAQVYSFVLAALAVGVFLGYLSRRN